MAETQGRELEQSLEAEAASSGGSAHFLRTDVASYRDQLALFDAAHEAHGHVDYAIANAAVSEPHGFLDPETLDLETVQEVQSP